MAGAAPALPGPVMQLGYVVPDLACAARHWARLGIGPFLVLEHVALEECRYRGAPVRFDMSAALAQWGELQIELIEQHDEVPTTYTEFAGRAAGGLHHLGVLTDSVAGDVARLAPHGISPVQSGSAANGVRFAYLDTDRLPGAHAGGMIELIERCPAIETLFGRVREAARGWNGDDLLRPVRGP